MTPVRLYIVSVLQQALKDVQVWGGSDANDNLDDIFSDWPRGGLVDIGGQEMRWLSTLIPDAASETTGLPIFDAYTGEDVPIPSVTVLVMSRRPAITGLGNDLGDRTRAIGATYPQRTGTVQGYKLELTVRLWIQTINATQLETIIAWIYWAMLRATQYLDSVGIENIQLLDGGDQEPEPDAGGRYICQSTIDMTCEAWVEYVQNANPLSFGSVPGEACQ